MIPADKTNNYHKLNKEQYENMVTNNIQKEYMKSTEAVQSQVTMEDVTIAQRLELSDRIKNTAKRDAFITLKDLKPSFKNKPSCRLINFASLG